jgi:hypothetical protein
MEPEGSLPYSQEPATGHCPEPFESTSQLPTVFLRSALILSSHLCLRRLSALPFRFSDKKKLCTFLISPKSATRSAYLILLDLISLIILGEAAHVLRTEHGLRCSDLESDIA